MKDKVGTPVIIGAAVVVVALVGFLGWKFLGPKPSGKSTGTSADYQQKMQQMNQQQMEQMRNNAQRFRGGGAGGYQTAPSGPGGPPGPGGQ